ncbi:hypothetical protein D9M69_376740 [compost metagenome]
MVGHRQLEPIRDVAAEHPRIVGLKGRFQANSDGCWLTSFEISPNQGDVGDGIRSNAL